MGKWKVEIEYDWGADMTEEEFDSEEEAQEFYDNFDMDEDVGLGLPTHLSDPYEVK